MKLQGCVLHALFQYPLPLMREMERAGERESARESESERERERESERENERERARERERERERARERERVLPRASRENISPSTSIWNTTLLHKRPVFVHLGAPIYVFVCVRAR